MIRKLIPLKVKFLLRDMIGCLTMYLPNVRLVKKNPNKTVVYLLDTPTYTNLGDHAIAYAEKEFFNKEFPEYLVIEVVGYLFNVYVRFIKKNIKKQDILVLIGGGNFGDEYKDINENRRKAIVEFKNNRICIFPQTIYYSETENGKNQLKKMKDALKDRKSILIASREKRSYEFAVVQFQNSVILTPDIVLYLNKRNTKIKRNGVMLCFREDIEKKITFQNYIIQLIEVKNLPLWVTDTISPTWFPVKYREKMLKEKWNEFCSAKLVITDRLHGMIFSAITATPCIVLPNYNHKIESFYDTWFKKCAYIRYADTLEMVEQNIVELLKINYLKIEPYDYKIEFAQLKEFLR